MELDLLDPHSVLECLPACKNDSKFTGTKQVYYLFQIKIFSLCLISVMLSKHKQTEQYALAVHKIVNPLPLKTTCVIDTKDLFYIYYYTACHSLTNICHQHQTPAKKSLFNFY